MSAGCPIYFHWSVLNISTGPLARRTFQTTGPVRASAFDLSLARTGQWKICRATRFQIVLARTMTNHSLYFSRGAHPTSRQFSCSPFATARRQRDASRSRMTCRSNARAHWRQCLDHADTRLQCEHPRRIWELFSAKHMTMLRVNSFGLCCCLVECEAISAR